MVDEIFDRQYQAGRAQLNAGLDRAFTRIAREIASGLKAAHRLQWRAPWNSAEASKKKHARLV